MYTNEKLKLKITKYYIFDKQISKIESLYKQRNSKSSKP